MHVYQREPLKV